MVTRELTLFIAVAEELSFTRAAQRSNITQPVLSRKIQHLERRLGVQLFERTRRKVALTEAGKVFMHEARRILESIESGLREVQRTATSGQASGLLRLACPEYVHHTGLFYVLLRFKEQHPAVVLEEMELFRTHLLEALKQGKVDVGVVQSPVTQPELYSVPLPLSPPLYLKLLMPHNHPLAQLSVVPLERLEAETLLLPRREISPAYFDLVTGALERLGVRPKLRLEAHLRSGTSHFRAVASGAYLQTVSSTRPIPAELGLVARPLVPTLPVPLVAVRRDGMPSSAVKALFTFIEQLSLSNPASSGIVDEDALRSSAAAL